MSGMTKVKTVKGIKPTPYQRHMLKKRGLNPDDYMFIRESLSEIIFFNTVLGNYKIVAKNNRIG